MAFQMGFPKKLNVPQRKIENKSMGDINFSPYKGRNEVDQIARPRKQGVDMIITKKATGIHGCSPDTPC